MSELPTVLERVKFREAKTSDLTAINALINDVSKDTIPSYVVNALNDCLDTKKQNHWTSEYLQIRKGQSSYAIYCLIDRAQGYGTVLAGFIVLRICTISSKSFAIGAATPMKCTFDIIDSSRDTGLAIEVSYLYLAPSYRRYGLGSLILKQAVSSMISQDPTIEAIFSNVPLSDAVSYAFFESLNFQPLGYLPDYFKSEDSSDNSVLFALSVCEDPLARYAVKKGDEYPNLLAPNLNRAGLLPRWLSFFLCQYISPLAMAAFVFVLAFVISGVFVSRDDAGKGATDFGVEEEIYAFDY